MDNMTDALKIAFAMLVFVIAITLFFTMISKVKSTTDTVFYYADNTNFRPHAEFKDTNRQVSRTEVISTLYRYYNESIAVTVKLKDDKVYNFDKGNETIMEGLNLSKLNKIEEIEQNLAIFITTILPENVKFEETFVEVPTSGIYMKGDDGSEITISSGGKKIYITYEEV